MTSKITDSVTHIVLSPMLIDARGDFCLPYRAVSILGTHVGPSSLHWLEM